MKLVRQIGPTTCGHACLAMIHDVSIEAAISFAGHTGELSDSEIFSLSGTDSGFEDGPPPADVVAIQKHRDPNGSREHWTVSAMGKLLDPAEIGKRIWPVTKHMVIDWA